jgi:hypothetical protein
MERFLLIASGVQVGKSFLLNLHVDTAKVKVKGQSDA